MRTSVTAIPLSVAYLCMFIFWSARSAFLVSAVLAGSRTQRASPPRSYEGALDARDGPQQSPALPSFWLCRGGTSQEQELGSLPLVCALVVLGI